MILSFEEFIAESNISELNRRIKRKKKRKVKRSEKSQIARKEKEVKQLDKSNKSQLEILKIKIRKLKLKKKNANDTLKVTIQKQIDRLETQKKKVEILAKQDLIAKQDDALSNNANDTRLQRYFKKQNKAKLKDLKRK